MMGHSRASTMDSEGVIERRRRQKRSLGATIQGSAHRAFAEVRRTSGMCQDETLLTTLGLWEKHGIRQAGFWTVKVGESNQDLYYMLAWDSMGECETRWNAFQTDPAWIAARTESERDGLEHFRPWWTHVGRHALGQRGSTAST